MTTKNRIIDTLLATKRWNVEKVVAYLEESDFFTAQPHRHHREEGGLARHSLEVYHTMKMTGKWLNADSVAVVALLHDIATARHPAAEGISGHGRKSVVILEYLCDFPLKDTERDAILYHMHPSAKEIEYNPLAQCLCYADSTSAAKHPARP